MEWDSPITYVMTHAWYGIVISFIWHYAAQLTKPRIVTDMLERM